MKSPVDWLAAPGGLGWIERALMWSSNVELSVLRMATYETRLQFQGLGLLIWVVSLLSTCVVGFALRGLLFADHPWVAWSVAGVVGVGLLMLERELTDHTRSSWATQIVRGAAATLVGLSVGLALCVQVLNDPIEAEVQAMVREHAASGAAEQTLALAPVAAHFQTKVSKDDTSLKARLLALQRLRSKFSAAFWLTNFLVLFALALQLVPAITLVLLPRTEYHCFVAGRKKLLDSYQFACPEKGVNHV